MGAIAGALAEKAIDEIRDRCGLPTVLYGCVKDVRS